MFTVSIENDTDAPIDYTVASTLGNYGCDSGMHEFSKKDGLSVLREAKSRAPDVGVILMTAHGTVENAVEAMRDGAADYLLKPFSKSHLLLVVKRVLDQQQLGRERLAFQEEIHLRWREGELIGQCPPMQSVFKLMAQVAKSDAVVLITGETGTGKELVARAVHHLGVRRERPFVAVNCSAVPEGLMESELFGHERGSFTGAETRRLGKFSLAHQGTLFLDEIGDMPSAMQAKVLRAVQFGEFEMLGASHPTRSDVRIIAATHRDLGAEVRAGRFREDLWYRLNVFPIHLPPLRERAGDIPLLVAQVLERLARRRGVSCRMVPPALQMLAQYRYPGNVRELENILERAVILCEGEIIGPEHLWFGKSAEGAVSTEALKGARNQAVESTERHMILEALEASGWNRVQAAKQLKIDYKTLRRKITKYQLRPRQDQQPRA